MPPAPRISVLLPVRNGATHLAAALDSLVAQEGADFEVLVVDDGSTDRTPEIVQARAAADPRFVALRTDPHGLVAALNTGLARTRGAYIARMDADDVCHPQRLALQSAHLDAHPDVGLVACCVAFGGDPVAAAGYARHVEWTNRLLTHAQIAEARFREAPLAHPSVMFRREVPVRHGGYAEGPFPEDYELWLRWLEAGVRMEKLPEVLLTWNDPPARLSRSHPRYDRDRFHEIKAAYLARWLALHNRFHPEVYVIGAGSVTRRRARLLLAHGIRFVAYADLDPGRIGQRMDGLPVIAHAELPAPGKGFILPFVGSRGAPEYLRSMLLATGHVPGRDFIEAA